MEKNNAKTLVIIIVCFVAVFAGALFLGRCTGKAQFRATITELKESVSDSLKREQALTESIERERKLVAEMAGSFESIKLSIETVKGIWEHISVRIDELDEALAAQREIADIIADLDRRTRESASTVEGGLDEGLGYLDTAIERVQSGHP